MATTIAEAAQTASSSSVLNVNSLHLTDEEFFQLCVDNRDLRIELTSQGEMIVMGPTGSETGIRNSELNYQLRHWAKLNGTGETFDSSTGFTLPNGAKRSPDASWIRKERYEALTLEERKKFAPICPDFVVELKSEDDRLSTLQKKMVEYIDNGSQLGWLLNPTSKQVYIYRPNQEVEVLENPKTLSGESILPGFVLDLNGIL